jgi:hypothetical protein
MKLRTLILAVAVLAVLSAAAYLGNRPKAAPPADPRVGRVLLDPDTAAVAAGLVVEDQGKRVELTRGPGGSWTDASYYNLPADAGKISQLARDLNEAKVERLVTVNPERLAHLGFKDSSIAFRDSSGREIWRLVIGNEPDSGSGRFIRFGDEPRAFFSGLHVWLDTDPKAWADTRLLDLKPDDIASVKIPFESGAPVVASRAKKDSPWTTGTAPTGQRISADKLAPVLTSLTSLSFSDTADKGDAAAAAAAQHMRTVTLKTFDGRTITISLGRKPEEKRLKATAADAKEGLASLGKLTDTKAEAKPAVPEFDTIPAGPVFAVITSSDAKAAINDLMKRRAFEVDDYVFTGLPQKPDDLLEADKGK